MIVRRPLLLLLLGLTASASCFSQDLCSLPEQARGFAPPLDADAYTVLDAIGKVGPFATRTIKLFPSSNALVMQRGGAAAQLCGHNANERWIFFAPEYIDAIRPNGGRSDLPRYFVLAHEAAHHVNGDTLVENNWTKDEELAADYSAAVWLTRLGVTRDQLLQTFDALGLPVESVNGYPRRLERRGKVIQGYEDTRAIYMPILPPETNTPPQVLKELVFHVIIQGEVGSKGSINNRAVGPATGSGFETVTIDGDPDKSDMHATRENAPWAFELTKGRHTFIYKLTSVRLEVE